jgi:ABC-type sugar transport system permease subunit
MTRALNYKHKAKQTLQERIFICLMIAYPLLQFLVFWVYVNFDTVVMTFQKLDYASGKEVFVGWDNYAWFWDLLTDSSFKDLWNCIKNSVILFLVNNFVILPISFFSAYIFYKKLKLQNFFRVVFFLPNIISIVVLTMAFSFMFDSSFGPVNSVLKAIGLSGVIPLNGWLGDKNTAMGMIVFYCIWSGIGGNVILTTGAINRIPPEVIEAGKIDGIGMWREFTQVVIPMIGPTIETLFITGITGIFTIFLQPQLLTLGGPYEHLSGTIGLYIVELVENGDLYKASTVGMVFSVFGIILVLLSKKLLDKITPEVEY